MAFILVIGGGFGINYSISDKKSVGIYVANANEVASIKKATPQDFTYQVYIGKKAMSEWQKDKLELLNKAEKLGNDDYTAFVRSGSSSNGKFKKEINFGNSFTWALTYLGSYISETEEIKFSDLNDMLIATVEYKDGSVIKRGFRVEFDNNGVGSIREIEVK